MSLTNLLLFLIFGVLPGRFRVLIFPPRHVLFQIFTRSKRTRANDCVRVRAEIVPCAGLLLYIWPYSRDLAVAFPKSSGAPRALRFFLRLWKFVRLGYRSKKFNRDSKGCALHLSQPSACAERFT